MSTKRLSRVIFDLCIVFGLVLFSGCVGEVETRSGCEPGEQVVCECANGSAGRATCQADNNFGECLCGPPDAGLDASSDDPTEDVDAGAWDIADMETWDSTQDRADLLEEAVDLVADEQARVDLSEDYICWPNEGRCFQGTPQVCDEAQTGWVDMELCWDDEICIDGECESLPEGFGEGCSDDDCPGDLVCVEQICLTREPDEVGSECWDDAECLSPAWCNGIGFCTVGELGARCAADSDCGGDTPYCALDRTCQINSPPTVDTNGGLVVTEGATATIDSSLLLAADLEHSPEDLTFTVNVQPEHGTLMLDGEALDTWFTQAEIDADLLAYAHDGTETTDDSFQFVVADPFGGNISETSFSITITPENDEPTLIELTPGSVAENAGAGVTAGALTATDPDDAFHTYSFQPGPGGEDNGVFQIDGTTLETAQNFDHEAQDVYHVRVRATDDGGRFREEQLVVAITDQNEAPTDIALSQSSVAENTDGPFRVGELSTTDEDGGDSFTYTLVAGTGDTHNGSFEIAGVDLNILGPVDHEIDDTLFVRVRTTDNDGDWNEEEVVVEVSDVNEEPTAIILSRTNVNENSGVDATVGDFSVVDPDEGDNAVVTLAPGAGDSNNSLFWIDGTALRTNFNPDQETQDSFSIWVRATDNDGKWHEEGFTITVIGENEAPTEITLLANEITENATGLIGVLTTNDPDPGDTADYSLVVGDGDTHNASFAIVNDDELHAETPFDYETQPSLSVRVRTTDSGDLSREEVFTIVVNDQNEAPTDIFLSTQTVAENLGADQDIATVSTTDEDGDDSATYSFVENETYPDNGLFYFTGDTLITAVNLDFEDEVTRTIRIRTTDG